MPTTTWSDWLEQQATPCQLLVADSRSDLVTKLQGLLDQRRAAHAPPPKLKVKSSGHATSAVGQPAEVLIQLDKDHWQDDFQSPNWLPSKVGGGTPVWLPANTTVKHANALLSARNLAFANLGSYDKQSVFGAITTGTHGTGRDLPPLADLVLAIDVVVVRPDATGALRCQSLRIEPADVPVSTAAYVAANQLDPSMPQLVRDTELFEAAVVSMGCFGIVTGVVVRAVDSYWLCEERSVALWSGPTGARALVDPWSPAEPEWLDFNILSRRLIIPGDWGVLVTRRRVVPAGNFAFVRDDARTNAARTAYNAFGPNRNHVATILAAAGYLDPDLPNGIAWGNFKKDVTDPVNNPPFVSTWNRVLFTSIGDYVGVSSTEICVPRAEWRAAVDTTLATLESLSKDGYHSLTPIGVRFSGKSRHLFAPQVGRETCSIEVGCLVGIASPLHPGKSSWSLIDHILATVETALVQHHQGRPHWGQRFFSSQATLQAAYPAGTWAKWKTQRNKADPARLFDNAFSTQMGL